MENRTSGIDYDGWKLQTPPEKTEPRSYLKCDWCFKKEDKLTKVIGVNKIEHICDECLDTL